MRNVNIPVMLRATMAIHGYDVTSLCELAGVSRTSFYKIIAREWRISDRSASALASVLAVTPAQLRAWLESPR